MAAQERAACGASRRWMDGANPMVNPTVEAVVTEHIHLLNEGEVTGSAATFADESLNHGNQVTPDRIGAVLRSLRMALPYLRLETVEMVSNGEVVVCRTVLRGTHLGNPEIPFRRGWCFRGSRTLR